jgi:hypothetical protein
MIFNFVVRAAGLEPAQLFPSRGIFIPLVIVDF